MTAKTSKATTEAEIRKLVEDWVDALRAKDVKRMLAHYSPEICFFGIAPPLEIRGIDAYRKAVEEWIPTFRGEYEIRNLSISASDNTAFCHSTNRLTGTAPNGQPTDNWVRVTVCFQKTNGKWLVTHEHVSVPFDMKTGQAAVDLKPQ